MLNLCNKFGNPRTGSSFSAKIFFFQNGVCCRKEEADDVMFCGNMSEGMLVNPIKFGEIRRNRLRERRRNVKIKMAAVQQTGSMTSFPDIMCRALSVTSIPNFVNFDLSIREKRVEV